MRWVTAGPLKRRWWVPISSYHHLMPWHRQFSTSAEIFLFNNLLRSQHVKGHLNTTFTDARQHWWARTFRAWVWTIRHQLMHLTWVPTHHRACWDDPQIFTSFLVGDKRPMRCVLSSVWFAGICLEMVSGAHPSLLGWLIVIRYKVNSFI